MFGNEIIYHYVFKSVELPRTDVPFNSNFFPSEHTSIDFTVVCLVPIR